MHNQVKEFTIICLMFCKKLYKQVPNVMKLRILLNYIISTCLEYFLMIKVKFFHYFYATCSCMLQTTQKLWLVLQLRSNQQQTELKTPCQQARFCNQPSLEKFHSWISPQGGHNYKQRQAATTTQTYCQHTRSCCQHTQSCHQNTRLPHWHTDLPDSTTGPHWDY